MRPLRRFRGVWPKEIRAKPSEKRQESPSSLVARNHQDQASRGSPQLQVHPDITEYLHVVATGTN